jgi:hypothetical protein
MTAALALTKRTLDVGIVPHDVDAMQRFYSEVLALPTAPPRPVQRATLIGHTVGTSVLKLLCVDPPPPREEGGIEPPWATGSSPSSSPTSTTCSRARTRPASPASNATRSTRDRCSSRSPSSRTPTATR